MKSLNAIQKKLFFLCSLLLFFSCKPSTSLDIDKPHDPNKPILVESFSPEQGGYATKVIISGNNFGNNPKSIKVYFNEKLANVVGCSNEKILVITPSQPGDSCKISVSIGDKLISAEKRFIYKTMVTVSTVVGRKGTTSLITGPFIDATLSWPAQIVADVYGNIFMSHNNYYSMDTGWGMLKIDENEKTVESLSPQPTGLNESTNMPSTDITGEIILFPKDLGDDYYALDPALDYVPKKKLILHPSAEDIANGIKNFSIDHKFSFAVCKVDEMIYTKSWNGQIVKFDPITRKGQLVKSGLPLGEAYLTFDPLEPNMLYMCFTFANVIYTFNIINEDFQLYAGISGVRGWKDGSREIAQFDWPRQIVFDSNNDLLIADENNHCIRKVDKQGKVSTLIGIPRKAGYQDGNPEDALFDHPAGITINKDGVVYISDSNNSCLRKIAIQ